MRTTSTPRPLRPWLLYVLAAPASVAVWSGWVGLGEMTGFGVVHPLPGIADHFTINSAITLPIGVESYAAYALGAWLTRRPLTRRTRRFARWSSIGALVLGACGQVAFHLLQASGHIRAPWEITTVVACLPVVVLGMGATLAHLIHGDAHQEPVQLTVHTANPNDAQVQQPGSAGARTLPGAPLAPVPLVICGRSLNLGRRAVNPAEPPVHLAEFTGPEPAEPEPTAGEPEFTDQPGAPTASLPEEAATRGDQVQFIVNLIRTIGSDAVTLGLVMRELDLKKTTAHNRLQAARERLNREAS